MDFSPNKLKASTVIANKTTRESRALWWHFESWMSQQILPYSGLDDISCTYHCSTIFCHLWRSCFYPCADCTPCLSHHWKQRQALGKGDTTFKFETERISCETNKFYGLLPLFCALPGFQPKLKQVVNVNTARSHTFILKKQQMAVNKVRSRNCFTDTRWKCLYFIIQYNK